MFRVGYGLHGLFAEGWLPMEIQRTIVLLSGGFSDGENADQDVFLLESSLLEKTKGVFYSYG